MIQNSKRTNITSYTESQEISFLRCLLSIHSFNLTTCNIFLNSAQHGLLTSYFITTRFGRVQLSWPPNLPTFQFSNLLAFQNSRINKILWIQKVSRNSRNYQIPWKFTILRDFVVLMFLDTFSNVVSINRRNDQIPWIRGVSLLSRESGAMGQQRYTLNNKNWQTNVLSNYVL